MIDVTSALAQSVMRATSPAALLRAHELLRHGQAVILESREEPQCVEWEIAVADGDGYQQWYETVALQTFGTGEMRVSCTCGAERCAHNAAALLMVAQQRDAGGDPQSRLPSWQRELDALLPQSTHSRDQELCLFFALERTSWQHGRQNNPGLSLGVRPGIRGARGQWIKGNVRWEQLNRLEGDSRVLELLGQLHSLYTSATRTDHYAWYAHYRERLDWLPLEQLPSVSLWDTLVEMQSHGVPFVSWRGKRAVLVSEEPARARLHARRDKGHIVLEAQMLFDDRVAPIASKRFFMGTPAVAVADVETIGNGDQITFRRLQTPVTESLQKLLKLTDGLRVEPSDQQRFEEEYLPRLQTLAPVESPDGSYDLPLPKKNTLLMEVTHSQPQVHIAFRWDRGIKGHRDLHHENLIISSVREASGEHATLLFGEEDRLSDRTLSGAGAVLFTAEVLPVLQSIDHLLVEQTGSMPEYRAAAEQPSVSIGTSSGENDWFDLQVKVTIEGEKVDFALLFTALSQGQEILLLPSGTYFSLNSGELDQLKRIIEEAKTLNDRPVERLRLSKYQVDLWEELVSLGIVEAQETQWWQKIRQLNQGAELTRPEVPETLEAQLRDYQLNGYWWLNFLREHQLGGVLADDMGLGKTLQVIAMMAKAHRVPGHQGAAHAGPVHCDSGPQPPFLVVAPTSVVGNWIRETERFAPALRVTGVTETARRRKTSLSQAVGNAQIVVTSYTLFRLEFDDYAQMNWSGLILDEAQMIKNHASQGYKSARLLDVPFKLAVTGTPMENNLLELWSLASLVCPGLLGAKKHFTEYFRDPIEREKDTQRLDVLQRRLQPFLLRRTKDLVATELPPKQEHITELELHPKHRRLYDRRLQRERQKVLGLVDDVTANRFEIFRSLTLLRQLALDAELADEGVAPSAKLDALAELLGEVVAEGHRVLVLSQFTRFLKKAKEVADDAQINNLYLDGSTRQRQKVIDSFREGVASVFFISLKAGGFGLNLTEADYVVLLDPWWNPATEAQAVDRAHRIGQTRPVMVYRLVAKNTIEAKVMALKAIKAQLFDRVLDDGGDSGGAAEASTLSADDIRALIE